MGLRYGPRSFSTPHQAQFCRHSREPCEAPCENGEEEIILKPSSITSPPRQYIRPRTFSPVEIPANPEEIKSYLIANGYPETGLSTPSATSPSEIRHRKLLDETVRRRAEIGLSSAIYHAFEVSIEDEDINGRGKIPNRMKRETDLAFLLSDGTLALVEASTRKNGTKRMENQLEDAMDWWWVNKGVLSSGIIVQKKPREDFKATFLGYDPRRSSLNKTRY